MHWRIQELLNRHGPRALMIGSIGVVAWLMLQGPVNGIPGYAEVAPVRVASLESAVVTSVEIAPGDVVATGQVVGQLDSGPIQGRVRILEAELERHGAALAGEEQDAQTALRLAEAEYEDADSRVQGTRDAIAAEETRLADRQRQVDSGLAAATDLEVIQLALTTLRGDERRQAARVIHLGESVEHARSQLAGSTDEQLPPALLEAVRARGVVQEELALLQERRRALTLRSPLSARVAAVHYRPGEVLPANAVLAELLPLRTTTVVACLPEQFGAEVRAGSVAELRPEDGGEVRQGTVVDVVGLVSEAPDRCKQRLNEFGWVRPVRVQVEGEGLVPGQRFEVVFGDPPPAETAAAGPDEE